MVSAADDGDDDDHDGGGEEQRPGPGLLTVLTGGCKPVVLCDYLS